MSRSVSNEPEDVSIVPVMLPVSHIQVLDEENMRRVDPKFVSKLAKNIQKNGLLQNLVVKALAEPVNGYTHRLEAGYQRMAALRELGWDEVPVKITDADASSLSVNMSENAIRKDANYIEMAQAAKRRMDNGDKIADIAEDMGKATSYIHQILPMIDPEKVRPHIQKAIGEGKFTFRVARALPSMTEKEQDKLLTDLETLGDGGSTDLVESTVRRKKNKTGKGRKMGRVPNEEKAQGAAKISTKKALLLIDEAAGYLKEAAKAEDAMEADAAKEAVGILGVFRRFLSGSIGVQALAKQLTKKME